MYISQEIAGIESSQFRIFHRVDSYLCLLENLFLAFVAIVAVM